MCLCLFYFFTVKVGGFEEACVPAFTEPALSCQECLPLIAFGFTSYDGVESMSGWMDGWVGWRMGG